MRRFLTLIAAAAAATGLFTGCEATQVGNPEGKGLDSGLSSLPHSSMESWENDARFGHMPQSR